MDTEGVYLESHQKTGNHHLHCLQHIYADSKGKAYSDNVRLNKIEGVVVLYERKVHAIVTREQMIEAAEFLGYTKSKEYTFSHALAEGEVFLKEALKYKP